MAPRFQTQIRRHTAESPWTYGMLDRAQRDLHARLTADPEATSGCVFLSELAPVITLGRRECSQDLLLPEESLRAQGVELYPTDRGGRATYHGPGQWVVFVVDRLERLTGDRRGVRRAVEGLLDLGCEIGRSVLGPEVHLKDGAATGVWTPRGKLASVGVHIQDGVLLHGLAINGYRTPQSFLGLKPCGLDAQVDFLFDSASDAPFAALPAALLKGLSRGFGFRVDEVQGAGLIPDSTRDL